MQNFTDELGDVNNITYYISGELSNERRVNTVRSKHVIEYTGFRKLIHETYEKMSNSYNIFTTVSIKEYKNVVEYIKKNNLEYNEKSIIRCSLGRGMKPWPDLTSKYEIDDFRIKFNIDDKLKGGIGEIKILVKNRMICFEKVMQNFKDELGDVNIVTKCISGYLYASEFWPEAKPDKMWSKTTIKYTGFRKLIHETYEKLFKTYKICTSVYIEEYKDVVEYIKMNNLEYNENSIISFKLRQKIESWEEDYKKN